MPTVRKMTLTILLLLPLAASSVQNASALTIKLIRAQPATDDPLNGSPGACDIGAGTLDSIVTEAAKAMSQTIRDNFALTLYYRWAPVGGGQHTLLTQGGTPNRETSGLIEFNNDCVSGHFHWWKDPTPSKSEEYGTLSTLSLDLGGGTVNIARFLENPTGDAADYHYVDLLSAVMHEMGHALGMSPSNASFMSTVQQASDGSYFIEITSPRPYSGTIIPLASNSYGVTGHIAFLVNASGTALMTGVNPLVRTFPSWIDTLAMAQVEDFKHPVLNPPFLKHLHLTAISTSPAAVLAPTPTPITPSLTVPLDKGK